MQTIMVVGSSGAGKTTMAATLAGRLGLRHIELDSLYHLPGWVQSDADDFRQRVSDEMRLATHGWVMCGGYESKIDDLRSAEADTVVWLDYSRRVIMRRVIWRTIRRAITREELWNGNREPLSNFTRWDPEKNVIRWSWVHFDQRRSHYEACMATDWNGLEVHRFTTPSRAAAWLDGID